MEFFYSDHTVTQIAAAVFVGKGKGTPIHKNRPTHGIAFGVNCSDTVYTFSDGRSLTCGSGECIFLPQGSNYTVSIGKSECTRPINSEKCGVYAINFKIAEENTYAPQVVKIMGTDNILSNFAVAKNAWRKKTAVCREDCIISVYRIIRQIKSEQSVSARKRCGALSPAIEYISNNCTEESISIPFLSELCNVSEPYFRRLFQREFACSPAVYIRRKRLEYACALLDSGEYSVTDAAMLSGFNSPAYFSREFRKEYGVSPSDFKQDM